ncbi:DrmB family protein, partial [Schaalia hyovaginalis]|uniref:DrmB family protein n=1 Tax=Schaalia hyovaginalis TaxID=29316 RepID=UPI0026F3560B
MNAQTTVATDDSPFEDDYLVDPLGDGERLKNEASKKNYAKVGSARPTTLLYTYGPGSVMDLPHFTVMPTGLDDWERIWARRDGPPPSVHAPRLLETVQLMLGHHVRELRRYPWQPTRPGNYHEGDDLGVPARIFPQWLRCTGCDLLAPLACFVDGYKNTHPFRPDQAEFQHCNCPGRPGSRTKSKTGRTTSKDVQCVPARYLLVCPVGHLDEFPYDWWVHEGTHCTVAENPKLEMRDTSRRGATAIIVCRSCGARRTMSQAQGEEGRSRLPKCRGRLPHLGSFDPRGCEAEARVMLVGASNLWFAATQSIIDMPRLDPAEVKRDRAAALRRCLGEDLNAVGESLDFIRMLLKRGDEAAQGLLRLEDDELLDLLRGLHRPTESDEERVRRRDQWDPVELLVPEWRYLQQDPPGERNEDPASGLVVSPRNLGDVPEGVGRILAIDRLRKVNAVLGFTRIDEFDRVDDTGARLVPLSRDGRMSWVPATEDRGEGIFLELDEGTVAAWEKKVIQSPLWRAHRESHRRNFERRFSETAKDTRPDDRLPPPRYWLVHTLAHALIREMAMSSGYGAASISERIYAWAGD